jgi:hypothetical protein
LVSRCAAVKIQTLGRKFVCRRKYLATRSSAIKLQAFGRKIICRRNYLRLLNAASKIRCQRSRDNGILAQSFAKPPKKFVILLLSLILLVFGFSKFLNCRSNIELMNEKCSADDMDPIIFDFAVMNVKIMKLNNNNNAMKLNLEVTKSNFLAELKTLKSELMTLKNDLAGKIHFKKKGSKRSPMKESKTKFIDESNKLKLKLVSSKDDFAGVMNFKKKVSKIDEIPTVTSLATQTRVLCFCFALFLVLLFITLLWSPKSEASDNLLLENEIGPVLGRQYVNVMIRGVMVTTFRSTRVPKKVVRYGF